MRIYLILTFLSLFMALSCNSYESAKNNEINQAQKNKQMIAKGFTQATVILQASEQGCPVILKTESESFDPVNIDQSFSIDQLEVWVKFTRLRRANRCNMAWPVSIFEIQKKAD